MGPRWARRPEEGSPQESAGVPANTRERARKKANSELLTFVYWWWSLTENQTHISAVSQPRSEALRPSRDSGEGFRATAHAHDCKFREADWHSQLPQLPGNLGDATWLSSRLSP